ncbi:MAG: AraC family transcriptional regulator [Tannerellaceae bacterium]|nr:AraC family transcriptional regulator [Tannerellaceae bacterium]
MDKKILPFNWATELKDIQGIDSIDNDLILLDKPVITSAFDYPFKVDVVTAIVCISGTTQGNINLRPYTTQAPCLVILMPGQILQYKHISEDFSGLFVVMSRRFTDSLGIQERLPLRFSVSNDPYITLNDEELEVMTTYYTMLQRAIRIKDHPYRMEIAKHLTMVFFYGIGHTLHTLTENKEQSKHEILVEKFLNLVQTHYREQRGLDFYADKLCLTPKHLSKVVKENSGTSASDWIDNHVALEAKALLKSTNMTIQQISDELNFPSQSFFGKYFKRIVGVAPKEYKRS